MTKHTGSGRKSSGRQSRPYRKGVGIVVINPAGLVFVARRIDTPDAWQMPQGGIDRGETPWEAARRELYEETNITSVDRLDETADWLRYDLPEVLAGRAWRGRFRGQQQKWFALRFTGSESEIDLTAHTQEFDAWRWAPAPEIVAGIISFKKDVYAAALGAFAPFLNPAP